jgi:hypothetical protein
MNALCLHLTLHRHINGKSVSARTSDLFIRDKGNVDGAEWLKAGRFQPPTSLT